jgi:aspartate racemase
MLTITNKTVKKKKIGLIGGIGPESTIEYYRLIIKRYQEILNTKEYPEITLHSINMTEMLRLVFQNRMDQLVVFLAERIRVLEKAGIDYAAIASNTPHIVFDRLKDEVGIPLISIVKEACRAMAEKKIQRAGLFGTKSTMTGGFYAESAREFGIEIMIPTPEEQNFIHDKYMQELIYNRIVPETRQELIRIVNRLTREQSIEGLVLGGTELPLILKQADFSDIRVFDTTQVHVESIVAKMIEN